MKDLGNSVCSYCKKWEKPVQERTLTVWQDQPFDKQIAVDVNHGPNQPL